MKIIDKYIVLEFLKSFVFSIIVVTTIYIIVDLFDMLSTFIDKKVGILVIIQYYLCESLYTIGNITAPISMLLACFLSVGNLSKHFELVAIRTSGVSLYRILAPIFGLGIIISILIFLMNETIVIYTNNKKKTIQTEKIYKTSSKQVKLKRKNVYYIGEQNRFYKIKLIDEKENTLYNVSIFRFGKDYVLIERIDAKRIVYENGKWHFYNGIKRTFKDNFEKAESFKEKIVVLPETIRDFIKEPKDPEDMNFSELKEYIEKLKRSGEEITEKVVDLYSKISFPFMNFIVTLFGLPLACRVRRSGFVLGFGISFFCSFLYYGFVQAAKALGYIGVISPYLGAWLPNIAFFVVGILFLIEERK